MILYIVYNTDLLDIPPANSRSESVQAFVDHTMLLAIGKIFEETHATLKAMMDHLEGGYDWAADHNSTFETSKFTHMDFSPKVA